MYEIFIICQYFKRKCPDKLMFYLYLTIFQYTILNYPLSVSFSTIKLQDQE